MNAPLEWQEQASLVEELRIKGLTVFHIPNGEHRNKTTAAKLKKMGVLPGVPDLFIVDPVPGRSDIRGVFVEMKRQGNIMPTVAQCQTHGLLTSSGFWVSIGRGAADAIYKLRELGYRV